MSLFPPRTQGEAQWQHCNYGYDRSKYNSMEDCMKDIDPSTKDELTDYGKIQQNKSISNTAGVGDKSNLLMYLLVAGGLYYAYSQGMFNKLIK